MKYRKKPVVIEATQWFKMGDHPAVTCGFKTPNGAVIKWDGDSTNCSVIKTAEGWYEVSQGDWIITGIKGEQYPCKPDIFEQSYEAVK